MVVSGRPGSDPVLFCWWLEIPTIIGTARQDCKSGPGTVLVPGWATGRGPGRVGASKCFPAPAAVSYLVGNRNGRHINDNREAGVKLLRFWSDLSIWNRYGLSAVMAAVVLALVLLIFF